MVVREIRYVGDIGWLPELQEWKKLKGFVQVKSQRMALNILGSGKGLLERRRNEA